jgi:hypothetical protein
MDEHQIDKAKERIELLASLAREYLHRYGTIMTMMGDDVTEEVMAVESVIREVAGDFRPMGSDEADEISKEMSRLEMSE